MTNRPSTPSGRLLSVAALAGALFLGLSAAAARPAEAKQVKYAGVHPVSAETGGGFCYIEGVHVHVYPPSAKLQAAFRPHDGAAHFVGDPVAHGYDGPKHAYYGHHPVHVDALIGEREVDGDEIEYCYLDGPHFHHYTPAKSTKFTVKGGVYWYTGEYPDMYKAGKPKYAKVNTVYKPMKYTRPVVVVSPPVEYRGPVVVVDTHAHVHDVHCGHLEVRGPSLEVHVGVPGVIVDTHHRHHKHKHKKWKHRGHGRGRGHWKH